MIKKLLKNNQNDKYLNYHSRIILRSRKIKVINKTVSKSLIFPSLPLPFEDFVDLHDKTGIFFLNYFSITIKQIDSFFILSSHNIIPILHRSLDMFFSRSTKIEFHNKIISELRSPDNIQFALSFWIDGKIQLVNSIICLTLTQFHEILHNYWRILSELDIELLDLFYSTELHIVASKLKIELKLSIAGELNTDKMHILIDSLFGNLHQ